MQEVGASYNHYRRTLRQLADRCEFETITVDQILRNKIVLGIQDSKVRERLLRKRICHCRKLMKFSDARDNDSTYESCWRCQH